MQDPYAVLGLDPSASDMEVRAAYRKLAKRYHPDRNAGDAAAEQLFKEISEAYAVLGQAERRRAYDRGEGASDGDAPWAWPSPAEEGPNPYTVHDTSDQPDTSFDATLVTGASAKGAHPGLDTLIDLSLRLEEAAFGTEKQLRLSGGRAVVIKAPPATEEGDLLRLKGQGVSDPDSGHAGDALVRISLSPHPLFRRQGRNLYLDVPVTTYELVLGARVTVPTLQEACQVDIPSASHDGEELRVPGYGMPARPPAANGDLYLRLRAELPRGQAKGLRDLMRRWRSEAPYNPREDWPGKPQGK